MKSHTDPKEKDASGPFVNVEMKVKTSSFEAKFPIRPVFILKLDLSPDVGTACWTGRKFK